MGDLMFSILVIIILSGFVVAMVWVMHTDNSKNNTNKTTISNPQRRYLKDVKVGDVIQIEWDRIKNGIGELVCLNNDPEKQVILLQVTWKNYEELKCDKKEKLVLNYDSKELANFNLLNPIKEPTPEKPKDLLTELNEKLAIAVKDENYSEAVRLRDEIHKLGNKPPQTK